MRIESSRGGRVFWLILGLALVGVFLTWVVALTLTSGPNWWMAIALFPIGIGIGTVLWLGRPAWIEIGPTDISYVPPLGSSKLFPRSSVKSIVRVPQSRGSTVLEFHDQDNRKLIAIEQGFAKHDVEDLAQFLHATLTWDVTWKPASLAEMMERMTPEERAELEKHMTKPKPKP